MCCVPEGRAALGEVFGLISNGQFEAIARSPHTFFTESLILAQNERWRRV